MGKLVGVVNRCQRLGGDAAESSEDEKAVWSVSIEGLGFLSRVEIPEQTEIAARFSVQWKQGARPNHWINEWAAVPLV